MDTTAPFPNEYMGSYSCHGIDGIHEKINQDRGCVVYPYNSKRDECLLMCLDGHGDEGDKVSDFVMRQIVVSLEKDTFLNSDPVAALKNAFITTDTALKATNIDYRMSGTTCVTIYAKGNRLYCANVGDSRAVMCSENEDGVFVAKELTRDHKPDDPEEQARIKASGGFVCPPEDVGLSARVYSDPYFKRGGLAMSRSIGDYIVKAVGVIPEPEVTIFDVEPKDRFIIIASDGIWDLISSQEAVEIVQSNKHLGYPVACQKLIETAATRWQEVEGDYRDDITAVIVNVPLPFTDESDSTIEQHKTIDISNVNLPRPNDLYISSSFPIQNKRHKSESCQSKDNSNSNWYDIVEAHTTTEKREKTDLNSSAKPTSFNESTVEKEEAEKIFAAISQQKIVRRLAEESSKYNNRDNGDIWDTYKRQIHIPISRGLSGESKTTLFREFLRIKNNTINLVDVEEDVCENIKVKRKCNLRIGMDGYKYYFNNKLHYEHFGHPLCCILIYEWCKYQLLNIDNFSEFEKLLNNCKLYLDEVVRHINDIDGSILICIDEAQTDANLVSTILIELGKTLLAGNRVYFTVCGVDYTDTSSIMVLRDIEF